MKIRLLPTVVSNQIAAGEVIDRPASVVRELVDNALDAGAQEIRCILEGGGHELIRIIDDGSGMPPEDARMAFERHATSKLSSIEDLDTILTLGFRGEALPSIASVTRIELTTRSASDPVATQLIIEGGMLRHEGAVAAPVGTSVEVRNLFFNVPARRKFLKSARSEEGRIKLWITQVSVANPGVRFILSFDGKEVLNLARMPSEVARAAALLKGSSVTVDYTQENLRVTGVVGHPSLAQASAGGLTLYVNHRLISDRMLVKAVKEGFCSTLKEREVPVGFVFIELPGTDVDVNVHPQKSEVRFRDSGAIFRLVYRAVANAVGEFRTPVQFGKSTTPGAWSRPPAAVVDGRDLFQREAQISQRERIQQPSLNFSATTATTFDGSAARAAPAFQAESVEPVSAAAQSSAEPEGFRFSELRYVGQVLECYLVCEYRGLLVMVDMHAAHERYNYNLVRSRFRARKRVVQELLLPVTAQVGELGLARVLEQQELLSQLGFDIEPFGSDSVVIRSTPSMIKAGDIEALFKELACAEEGQEGRSIETYVDHLAARIACHASIRKGDRVSADDIRKLFADLDTTEFSAACPHGRPVVVAYARDEVEAWFGRDR